MTPSRRNARALATCAAVSLAGWLAAAPAARAEITVTPDTADANTEVWLVLVAPDLPTSPPSHLCVEWTVAPPDHFLIRATALQRTPPSCPPIEQFVSLGKLPVGHYFVEARIEGETGIFNSVAFDVRSLEDPDAPRFDFHLAPNQPRPGEPIDLTLSTHLDGCSSPVWQAPVVQGNEILILGEVGFFGFPCGLFPRIEGQRFLLPGLPAGLKTLTVRFGGYLTDHAETHFTVAADATTLSTRGGAYAVSLRWTDSGGQHDALARQLTDESGSFWFFDRDNTEVTVKVLDGRAVNGKIWVFAASMTDLPFVLHVVEQTGGCGASPAPACRTRDYVQQAHKNRNFLDTGAF